MIEPLPGDIFRKGQVLNNTYEVEGVLGRGGTGEVYRARNQITGRVVAVKALKQEFSANDAYLEMMKREEEMRSILHPAVVRYSDCNRSDAGHVYLVMDYVDGTPLSDLMARGGVPARDLMIVAQRIAEGLVATHARRIVHRDLSPDNIILRGGDPAEAVIIDFGIAKDANLGARTIVGDDFAGKYEYAAPEQLHGRAEPRSDLYALGALLLASFRGEVADLGRSPGEVLRRKERPLDTEGVPQPLKGLIEALTQPDPARRPPSAAAVVAEIEGFLKPAAARPGRRLAPGIAAALALVLLAGAGILWGPGLLRSARPPPLVDPYRLTAGRAADGASELQGLAPDPAARDRMLAAFAAAGGTAPPGALDLAAGAPVADWGGAVAALIATLAPMEDWRLEILGREARASGLAPDLAAREAARTAFAAAATAAGLAPRVEIAAGPRRLSVAEAAALLAPLADCGPLSPSPPAAGADYPLGGTIAVTGAVAERGRIAAIRDALSPAIGDRGLGLAGVAVLNPPICRAVQVLPTRPSGAMSLELGQGDRPGTNFSGRYAPGDNPVIDLLLPAPETEGHLWVALVDMEDMVYHLLPTADRPETAIAALGRVEGPIRRIRASFSRAEHAADRSLPALEVDARAGLSEVIALRTDRPLFDIARPQESGRSFAQGLAEAQQGGVAILAIARQSMISGE